MIQYRISNVKYNNNYTSVFPNKPKVLVVNFLHFFATCSATNVYLYFNRGNVVGNAARVWAGWSAVRVPEGVRDSSLLRNVHTGSGVHLASYSLGTGDLSSR
jgi:hypothetical protein